MELPTKKTLDDIERFGIEFSNSYTAIKNLNTQSLQMAKKYLVISETFDESGVRVGYEFHPNLAIYSDDEKSSMLAYYDFLVNVNSELEKIEYMNGINFYDVMNTRSKLDMLVSMLMGGHLMA